MLSISVNLDDTPLCDILVDHLSMLSAELVFCHDHFD